MCTLCTLASLKDEKLVRLDCARLGGGTKEIESEATSVKSVTATVTDAEVSEVEVMETVQPVEALEVDNIPTKDKDTEK